MSGVTAVSVFHNRAQHVARSVESLLAQDHADLVILLVDDGSTDDTLASLRRFEGGNVQVVTHPNIGFTRAITNAVAQTTTPYIALLGSGDSCHPDRISKQARLLDERHDVGVVGCGTVYVDFQTGEEHYKRSQAFDGSAERLLLKRNLFHHGEIMFRRSTYDEAGGYRDFFTYAQDRDLLCRMSHYANFYFLDEVLYRRADAVGESVRSNPEKFLLQRCLSDFAVQLHAERLQGQIDRLERFGASAGLLGRVSLVCARELRQRGVSALRRGRLEHAHAYFSAAHAQRPHLVSWTGRELSHALKRTRRLSSSDDSN